MFWRHWQELPKLIRFVIQHFAIGVLLGWASALMVLWYDIGGIGTLLARHDSTALLALFFAKGGLYFGTIASSVAIMNMGKDGSGGGGLGARLPFEALLKPGMTRTVKVRHTPHPARADASNVPRNRGRASG